MNKPCIGKVMAILALWAAAAGATDVMSDTWSATDALGRTLPGHSETGPPRADKFVGIFYFTWHGQHGTAGPYDITKLLAANPSDPAFGPRHAFHHWGESQFGYYLSDDEYVIRKHAHELAAAGVDTLILDVTNAFPYTDNYLKICQVYTQIRAAGGRTPQICFIAYNGDYVTTVQSLYDNLYGAGLYPDIWFRWQGKPLLLAPPTGHSQTILDFFTIRESWAWNWAGWFGTGQHKWPWLDDYPQAWGWDTNPSVPEEMPVGVASHPTRNIGRSYSGGSQPPLDPYNLTGLEHQGLFFEEQWSRALAVDPEFIYVTGWNEWVAQRFIDDAGGFIFLGQPLPPGGSYFVDSYNQEYNRDIEPMKGGHSDNYYYQLTDKIRRFKGARSAPVSHNMRGMTIDGDFAEWGDIEPEFRDVRGDAINRDHSGWGGVTYTNTTARNDFLVAKVNRDFDHVFFYVQTVDPITSYSDPNWMMLLLDADRDATTGWEGFDYIVNRSVTGPTQGLIERNTGGWNWQTVGTLDFAVVDDEMELRIPRSLLDGHAMTDFEFKWSDNMQDDETTETENTEYWIARNNIGPLSAPDGVLTFDVLGVDPFLSAPDFSIDASTHTHVTLRMRSYESDDAQIFWKTLAEPYESQAKSQLFATGVTGQFHDYTLDLTAHPEWTGTIIGLRVDPTGGSTTGEVAIDYVRICSAPVTGNPNPGCAGGLTWEFLPADDRTDQFRLNGDAAPDLRFKYRYIYERINANTTWALYE